jgi:hypothetical protein
VNITKRMCRLAVIVGILALTGGLTASGARVNEVCVVAGDIDYCAPHNL